MLRIASILMIPALALTMGACSLGDGLSTGSVFGSKQTSASAVAAPPPVTAEDRATQVAATSARAERCGFNFNADRLRANYLASESAAGTASDMSQRYDVTRKSLIAALVKDEGYCSEGRTKAIKADLGRHLAGDFAPAAKKQDVALPGLFDSTGPGYRVRETVNPEVISDPTAKKTKRIEY